MKKALRNTTVFLLSLPLITAIHVMTLFRGRLFAERYFGPMITRAAKRSLRYWIPSIRDASQFDMFRHLLRQNIRRWKPLYDIRIVEDIPQAIRIHVCNCPFCEVFKFARLGEMNRYFCRADWDMADKNSGKWTFERTHTIAEGGRYCDHTYKRPPTG